LGCILFIPCLAVVSAVVRRERRRRELDELPPGVVYRGEARSTGLRESSGKRQRGDIQIDYEGATFSFHRSELNPPFTIPWSEILRLQLSPGRLRIVLTDYWIHEFLVDDYGLLVDQLVALRGGAK
jgi:hypothetical protein